MPPKLLAELIILDDVIPDDLQSALIRNNKIFNKERRFVIYKNEAVCKRTDEIRFEKYQLNTDDYLNFETDENIEFIKKYPQFKPLIDHIEYRDTGDIHTIVRTVPIDQYLAEN
ncbi:MAG: hypothetical protein Q4P11_00205 [Methanobrevibacter sp.]|nr:hypothetical protein [Methanobrevibacter sp.]